MTFSGEFDKRRQAGPAGPPPVRETAYARAALDAEVGKLRSATEGTRNDQLNTSAFSLGQLVAGGELSEIEVWDALYGAAISAGLEDAEVRATLRSGLGAGKQSPRSAPADEREFRHPSNGQGQHESDPQQGPDEKRFPIEIIGPDTIFAPLEKLDYVVEGVIRAASLTEIMAYGASGKSWLATDLMISVALGKPWLGRFPTKQGQALIWDYENGSYEERRRAQAVAKSRGERKVDGIGIVSMPTVYMHEQVFTAYMQQVAKGRAVVIIDTLKAGNPGIDENDSNMRVGLDSLRRVGEQTGCAFVVLVHSKKRGNKSDEVDPRELGRGSSAIFDAADTVLAVEYTKGEPMRVSQSKSRMGRSVEPFQVEIWDGEDGSVHVEASDLPTAEAAKDFEDVCTDVLRVLRETPSVSGNALAERMKLRRATVSAALEMLQRNGAATVTGKGPASRWHPVG